MLHVQEIVSSTQTDPHRATKYLYPLHLWHQLLKVQNHTTSCLKMNDKITVNLFQFISKRLIISYDTQDNETCK